jgi:hypothetical protein
MEIKGEYQIDASREVVWGALNDPEMLKKCIPGCESLEQISDTELKAKVMAAIGPVKARFDTRLSLENLNPPESYTLVGESKAGMAGFGRGSAAVRLEESNGGTLLTYNADFKVGGKLAQVGSRLVMGATKKTADDFFGTFSRELDPGAMRMDIDEVSGGAVNSMTWKAIGAAIALLLIWWFLLR